MGPHPTGAVTFMFTDIEGSTRLWDAYPHLMPMALALHDELLHERCTAHHGYVFGVLGDGFAVAFSSPLDAVEAAVDIQQALRATTWPHGEDLRVRIAIDTGIADERNNEYYGMPLNRLGRMMKEFEGGSSVVTATTAALVRHDLPEEISLTNCRSLRPEDFREPITTFDVTCASPNRRRVHPIWGQARNATGKVASAAAVIRERAVRKIGHMRLPGRR